MKQKVLLTGASGGIGFEVLKQFVSNGNISLTVILRASRKNKKMILPFIQEVTVVFGDLSKTQDIAQLETSFDAVIHLAALIPPQAYISSDRTYQVNVLGTHELIKHLEKTSPKAFFMFSSSIAIYGDRLKTPHIMVTDPLHEEDEDFYVQSKIKAERVVQKSTMDWTIYRLTAILGVNNHKITGLMFHNPLDTCMEIATPKDAARAFVNGINHRQALAHKVFNLGGGENCRTSYRSLLEKNLEINGLGKLDFPKKSFAEKNFHCGYMMDSDVLEEIVRFRRHTLEDYYRLNEIAVSKIQKFFSALLKKQIKYFLGRMSLPLKAYRGKDTVLMERFFE